MIWGPSTDNTKPLLCLVRAPSTGYEFLRFVFSKQNGKISIHQPGKGAVYANAAPDETTSYGGYKRNAIRSGSFPTVGHSSRLVYYQKNPGDQTTSGSLYDGGLGNTTGFLWPNNASGMSTSPILRDSDAYTSVSRGTHTFTKSSVSLKIAGFKINAHATKTINIDAWVMPYRIGGGWSGITAFKAAWCSVNANNSFVSGGNVNFQSLVTANGNSFFRLQSSFNAGSYTHYISLPILASSYSFDSGQAFFVESYYSFRLS